MEIMRCKFISDLNTRPESRLIMQKYFTKHRSANTMKQIFILLNRSILIMKRNYVSD